MYKNKKYNVTAVYVLLRLLDNSLFPKIDKVFRLTHSGSTYPSPQNLKDYRKNYSRWASFHVDICMFLDGNVHGTSRTVCERINTTPLCDFWHKLWQMLHRRCCSSSVCSCVFVRINAFYSNWFNINNTAVYFYTSTDSVFTTFSILLQATGDFIAWPRCESKLNRNKSKVYKIIMECGFIWFQFWRTSCHRNAVLRITDCANRVMQCRWW